MIYTYPSHFYYAISWRPRTEDHLQRVHQRLRARQPVAAGAGAAGAAAAPGLAKHGGELRGRGGGESFGGRMGGLGEYLWNLWVIRWKTMVL